MPSDTTKINPRDFLSLEHLPRDIGVHRPRTDGLKLALTPSGAEKLRMDLLSGNLEQGRDWRPSGMKKEWVSIKFTALADSLELPPSIKHSAGQNGEDGYRVRRMIMDAVGVLSPKEIGTSVGEDSVLIDLYKLRDVVIAATKKTAMKAEHGR